MAVDVRSIVVELGRQGWECVLAEKDGARYKAKPPDKSRPMVVFSSRPSSTLPILRDLRNQGFVWPPGSNGREQLEPESRVTSTPFPPRPNPESSTLPQDDEGDDDGGMPLDEPQGIEMQKTPPPANDDAVALAFIQLREAKEYEKLAASDLLALTKEMAALQARVKASSDAYKEALESLSAARKAFDVAFDKEPDVGRP